MIPLYAKENIGKNLQLVEALREIANEKEMTIPQLAFAWLLAKGEDILPLIGSTRIASLKDSLKALDIKLTSDDMKQIEVAMPVNEIAGASFPDMRFRNGEVVR
ncbi:aldo/keto reductase [Listeria ivanovii]|nr:aldo/keto reductase [Listeria ivanovii]SNV48230.1 2,5-diketo-D-gluconate reductase B [Listeria ivanovii subsp. ivanovii]SNV98099.1 2,5-diketo-D-gluconate reductase B [Listeria ivanovii subsp. ivanovii]